METVAEQHPLLARADSAILTRRMYTLVSYSKHSIAHAHGEFASKTLIGLALIHLATLS